jgi:hypothetical protein
VILASALTSNLGGHGHATIGGAAALPPGVREKIAPPMAAAFGQTFWWALALIVVALAGSLALPRQKPELTADQADAAPVPLG